MTVEIMTCAFHTRVRRHGLDPWVIKWSIDGDHGLWMVKWLGVFRNPLPIVLNVLLAHIGMFCLAYIIVLKYPPLATLFAIFKPWV